MKVLIVRSPQKYFKISEIEVNQIKNVRWDNVSGGYNRKQSGYSLYGFIPYSLANDLVDCSGRHEEITNNAKICIPCTSNKKSPYCEGFKYLISISQNEKPRIRPDGFPPCTKKIIQILKERKHITSDELRGEIQRDIDKEGYEHKTIRSAIYRLKQQNKIRVSNKNQLIEWIELDAL